MTESALTLLADLIRRTGPIGAVRVSAAQARGYAKRFSYWGAVRYEIRLARDGHVTSVPVERATSDRRSIRLAEADAERIAASEQRVWAPNRGPLDERAAASVLCELAALDRDAAAATAAA